MLWGFLNEIVQGCVLVPSYPGWIGGGNGRKTVRKVTTGHRKHITALKSSELVSMKLQKTPQLSLSQFQSTELSLLFSTE